jgi:hypothetical protein
VAARSWEFILEEAGGEILLARRYPCARLYPDRELEALAMLRRSKIAGAPAGLERSCLLLPAHARNGARPIAGAACHLGDGNPYDFLPVDAPIVRSRRARAKRVRR